MSLYEAIELLVSKYTYATAQEWIHNPLAWALYQVWKEADAEREEE